MLEVPPTLLDVIIAELVCRHVEPAFEKEANIATYLADGHVIGVATALFWLASRPQGEVSRARANQLALGIAAGLALPHILKRFVNQIRPDRTIYPPRHGIPKSGKPYDAFPSGHAVHLGVAASALSRFYPEHWKLIWGTAISLAATRIALLAHWSSDVVAGLAMGRAVDWIVSRLMRSRNRSV